MSPSSSSSPPPAAVPDAAPSSQETSVPHGAVHTAQPSPFPWPLFLLSLGAATASHWLAVNLFAWTLHAPGLSLILGSFAATCLLAWWLNHEHHHRPWPTKWERLKQFLLGLGVFTTGIWFALALEHWLLEGPAHLERHPGWFLGIAGLIIIAASLGQNRLKLNFHRPRNLSSVPVRALPAHQRARALIICLSPPNQKEVKVAPNPDLADHCHAEVHFGNSKSVAYLRGQSLKADSDAISRAAQVASDEVGRNVYFNWQPLLRAVEPHPHLERLFLLGSPGDRGSYEHLEKCRRFLTPYVPHVRIDTYPKPVDFENFDVLVGAIREVLLKRWRDLPASDIVVDITGGQKVASIVGATLTLNLATRVQYVQTNAPHEALIYQLAMERPPSPQPTH